MTKEPSGGLLGNVRLFQKENLHFTTAFSLSFSDFSALQKNKKVSSGTEGTPYGFLRYYEIEISFERDLEFIQSLTFWSAFALLEPQATYAVLGLFISITLSFSFLLITDWQKVSSIGLKTMVLSKLIVKKEKFNLFSFGNIFCNQLLTSVCSLNRGSMCCMFWHLSSFLTPVFAVNLQICYTLYTVHESDETKWFSSCIVEQSPYPI